MTEGSLCLADGTGVVIDVRADGRIEPQDAEAFEVLPQACARPVRASRTCMT
jgi:hypothetical protein